MKTIMCFFLLFFSTSLLAQTEIKHQLKNELTTQYTFSSNGHYLVVHSELGALMKEKVSILKTEDGVHYEPIDQLMAPEFLSGFGESVDMTKEVSRIVVGAPRLNNNKGAVFIYEKKEQKWVLIHQLESPLAISSFGKSVAISGNGNKVLVGAPDYYGGEEARGMCFVYDVSNPDTIPPPNIIRPSHNEDQFGRQVRINEAGTIIAIGSSTDDWKERCEGAINAYQLKDSLYMPLGQRITLAQDTCTHFATRIDLSADGLILASGVSSKKYAALVWEYNAATQKWEVLGAGIPPFGGSRDHSPHIALDPQGKVIALSKALGGDYGEAMVYEWIHEEWRLKGNKIQGGRGQFAAMAFNFPLGIMIVKEVYMPKNIPDLIEELRIFKWE